MMKLLSVNLLTTAISTAIAVTLVPQAVANEVQTTESNFHEIIVISGSRMEQTLDQVAGSVVVIDEEAIARNMSTDFSSLFRNESAIGVKGGAGKPTTVTIRGIGGNRVMMVKDGVRVNNQYASPLGPGAEGTGRGLTEVEGLKQVEVLKAAASTMYGSDALGGVVVMRTKDASDYLMGDDYYVSVNAGYAGVNDEYAAGFTSAAAYGGFENLLTYQHRTGEEQPNFYDTQPDSDLVQDSVLFKSKYHFNEYTSVQLTLDYLEQTLKRWEYEFDKVGELDENVESNRDTQVINGAVQLVSKKPTQMHDTLTVTAYFGQTEQLEHRDYYEWNKAGTIYGLSEVRDYSFEDQRIGINSTFSKYIGGDSYGHQFTYGLDYEISTMSRHRTVNNPITGDTKNPFTFATTDSQRLGIFVQDDVTLLDGDLNLIAGLRYDYFRNTPDQQQAVDAGKDPANFQAMSDNFWSPKLGLVYQLADSVSVYGQYAYGYKMPTPDQKWGELEVDAGSMTDVMIQANYDLESEQSHTWEIGVRGNHSDTQYELTAFYTQVKDYIDWQYVSYKPPVFFPEMKPMEFKYQYFNRDEVTLYGAEAQINHWLTDSVELWGNVSYTYGEDENGDYLNSVSPLKGNAGINWYTDIANMEADFGAVVRWADDMSRTNDIELAEDDICAMGLCIPKEEFNEVYGTAGYAVMDLTFGLRIDDNWKLRAGVYNLFDKEYIDYTDVAGQSVFLLGASMDLEKEDFTQPGRYFSVKVNYQF
ncbi:TonB-dependent hemoglobin/transferrin/lactoferrin family receptor [Shewanella sp. D64]|uniref:TonB-dependent hemoglobin/transferrin/lactoferrin family receptor n=1 Tax=unclassified Shewanella TaxID=196818 RepID=UPI0022BA1EE9|nr:MULTISPECIES: TonB-dependent hemoglobin/transferrin/lactoferrin family receptor [unclassified Shewanella]MEC4727899.1 TonB-dependent hemoglobin/transferrin/lactoferrin family receptor [Shewanella sp. D64]MEC4739941.1 TonB-dependent hemoglobin/transferrin/lactoferrin family receptor [Shewanella sp. E94]WBJ97097.1 TonB-dependent hemoglobin/transferrin/lactoferrin family receptor [Shewanella sp. MTB7]